MNVKKIKQREQLWFNVEAGEPNSDDLVQSPISLIATLRPESLIANDMQLK